MTVPLLSGPDPAANEPRPEEDDLPHGHKNSARDHRPGGPHARHRIATEEECLAALSRLPALVALGMLTTSQANTVRSIYVSILQHHQKQPAGTGRPRSTGGVFRQILRRTRNWPPNWSRY